MRRWGAFLGTRLQGSTEILHQLPVRPRARHQSSIRAREMAAAGREERRVAAGRARRKILGLGFWVQGFRCFPWTGVNFFLKDGLKVAPSTLQMIHNSANMPMVGKPLYGFLSDAVYIRGQHRLPYIACGALLQALSWLTLAIMPSSIFSIPILSLFLFLSNLGAAIAEVSNDAIVAETSMQSLVSTISSLAGILGNVLGGAAIAYLSPRAMFILFAFLLTIQFIETIDIPENSLDLQKKKNTSLKELLAVVRKPEIFFSIIWVSLSYAIIPVLTQQLFYYQTQNLGLSSSVISLSKVFAQVSLLFWSIVYNRRLRKVPTRKLLALLQLTSAVFILSDAIFVMGFYREIRVSDAFYAVVFSGFQEALFQFKILPFSVMLARLCPPGCEGSVMAFLTSSLALAGIVSGYLGVVLTGYFRVSEGDFLGFPQAIAVEAACALVPILFLSWVPGNQRRYVKGE